MDIIYIRDLRIETIIGIYEWERHVKQILIFDLEMGTDIKTASKTDSVNDALNYKDITKAIIDFVEDSQYQLIETLAERLAKYLQQKFKILWLKLSVNKRGALRRARDVGIIIERGEKI